MHTKIWHKHYDYSVPMSIHYPRIPASDLYLISCKVAPDKPALNFYGTEITFWQLRSQVRRLANAMVAMGIGKGDRVGIHLPNCPQYVIAYLATLSIGAVVVNMNPLYTPDELKFIITDTGLCALFTFDMVLPNVKPVLKDVRVQHVIVTRMTDYIQGFNVSTPNELNLEENWKHFSQLIEGAASDGQPKSDVSWCDPALIQFTGGTTGVPKGAVLTHENIIAGVLQVSQWGNPIFSLMPPEKRTTLCVIPFFHVFGNILAMNWALHNCSTQILVPRFDLEELIGILSKFDHITSFPAVPTLITALINHPKAKDLELDRKLGFLISGGAPMPVELIEQIKDMGIFFCEGWGMSECASVGLVSPIIGLKKAGSVGIPIPDVDMRMVDLEEGKVDVKPGEPGELIIKGPQVMQGYWNKPEETAGQLKDGWLYTGDIVQTDEDGYVYIVDRKKDMIIAGGFNIYPREVDEVLFQHPDVLDACTVGIPDSYRGETVVSFVVRHPGQTTSEKEIIDFCKTKLVAYKVPKKIEFREALPKSAVSKILRKILRDEVLTMEKR